MSTNIELFLLSQYTSTLTIVLYKEYARKQGWQVGLLCDSIITEFIGYIIILGIIITSFFLMKWYIVLIGILIGWLINGFITGIFKQATQFIAILMFLLSWIFILIKF